MTDETKREVRRAHYDVENMTVRITSNAGGEVVLKANDVPEHIHAGLMLRGLFYVLRTSDDLQAAFADLCAGKLRETKAAKPKELDPWRRAFAAALVEQTKKSPDPISAEDALDQATRLDRSRLPAIKKNPAVVKHYQKITGTESDLRALLDAPQPSEPALAAD